MVSIDVRRCDGDRRRRVEVARAIRDALSDRSVGRRCDAGTLRRVSDAIARGIGDAATHVVVGRGDFNANLRFAKKSLFYATARAEERGPMLRVLVFDSLSLGSGVSGSSVLAFRAMAEEAEEAEATRRGGGATCASGGEGTPRSIVNTALRVLNDESIDDTDGDARATALREELTRKFGSFWYVISDESDFSVSCRASELPKVGGGEGETVPVVMRFQRGKCVYEVWHHVAPFDRFGFMKMTWAQKAKYARYALLLVAGASTFWYKSQCATEAAASLACRILPKLTPVVLGLFIFFVVSGHVDMSAWRQLDRKKD